MKYCPKCGTELNDDASFCTKCGAKQEVFKPEPMSEYQQNPLEDKNMSDSEKFRYLMDNDEKFRDIYTVSRKKRFFNFINLAAIIPFLVCLLIPIGMFNGIKVSDVGNNIFSSMGYTFPHTFSAFSIFGIKQLAGNYSICPGDNLNGIMGLICFIFGWILFVLNAVFTGVGTPKSYYLKTWQKEGGQAELMKFAKQNNGYLVGVMGIFFGFAPMLTTFMAATNIDYAKAYSKNGGKVFVFGEVSELPSGLIIGGILAILFMVVIIVTISVLTSLVTKKLNKYQ